jgi:MFS superfamily sulfate permease-like transporter
MGSIPSIYHYNLRNCVFRPFDRHWSWNGCSYGVYFLRNFQNSYLLDDQREEADGTIRIVLSEEVSFLNKGALIKALEDIPEGRHVIIDGSRSKVIDYDVLEVIENFKTNANSRNIEVDTIKIKSIKVDGLH